MVPNVCLYPGVHYKFQQTDAKRLLIMRKPFPRGVYTAGILNKAARSLRPAVKFVDSLLNKMTWKSWAENFTAIAYFPYTFSQMVFYELYNMNVPIVMPSLQLAKTHSQNIEDPHNWWLRAFPREKNFPPRRNMDTFFRSFDYYSGMYPHLIYFDSIADMVRVIG